MATQATPPRLICPGCGYENRHSGMCCTRCSVPLRPDSDPRVSPEPGAGRGAPSRNPERDGSDVWSHVWPGASERLHDNATRYLCAAAHLDPGYARDIIAEYLVEPTRAVPPSAGVDTVAVLGEAVAARYRGKIRDGMLVLLFLLFAIEAPLLALSWLTASLVPAAVTAWAVINKKRWSMVARVLTVVLVAMYFPSLIFTGAAYGYVTSGGFTIRACLFGLLIFGVLLADEFVVAWLTRHRFRAGTFQANAQHLQSGWERTVRSLGHASLAAQFNRIAQAERTRAGGTELADIVVHRTWNPFIGAGVPVVDEQMALQLKPTKGDDERRRPQPFTAEELQAHVARAVTELRGSTSLSPGRRFSGLTVRDQVLIPADRLVANLSRPPVPGVLMNPAWPPAMHMPIGLARSLVETPPEAARYYRCFQVEAWDRDLAVSCFFSAGTDESTLYLEWTHCVLYPVREDYRRIDRPVKTRWVMRALYGAVTLPVYFPVRAANLFHSFRRIRQRSGALIPDRYGAGQSLRERAADTATQTYFQDADVVRYRRIIEQVIFRAVSYFLKDHGYSIDDILEVARANISNNNVTIQGGSFTDSAIGIGHTSQTNSARRSSSASRSATAK